jgi:hypothetical protein
MVGDLFLGGDGGGFDKLLGRLIQTYTSERDFSNALSDQRRANQQHAERADQQGVAQQDVAQQDPQSARRRPARLTLRCCVCLVPHAEKRVLTNYRKRQSRVASTTSLLGSTSEDSTGDGTCISNPENQQPKDHSPSGIHLSDTPATHYTKQQRHTSNAGSRGRGAWGSFSS